MQAYTFLLSSSSTMEMNEHPVFVLCIPLLEAFNSSTMSDNPALLDFGTALFWADVLATRISITEGCFHLLNNSIKNSYCYYSRHVIGDLYRSPLGSVLDWTENKFNNRTCKIPTYVLEVGNLPSQFLSVP